MYMLCHKITIADKYLLKLVSEVEIVKSVDKLADTATVIIPERYLNKDIDIESKISAGDTINIELGYNDELKEEFSGYICRVRRDDKGLRLECEDAVYLLRKEIKNKAYKKVDVKQILTDVCKQIGLTVECSYSFSYDKYTILNATAWEVVDKIQQECGANVYVRDDVLVVEPKYVRPFNGGTYSMERNIERGGCNLSWRDENSKPLLVECEGTDSKGVSIKATAGRTGGDKMTIKLPGVSDRASLQRRADEVLKEKNYTGYEGKFRGWLLPYTDKGYKIRLKDSLRTYKEGDYYVKSVKVTYSEAGGCREIEIGRKI